MLSLQKSCCRVIDSCIDRNNHGDILKIRDYLVKLATSILDQLFKYSSFDIENRLGNICFELLQQRQIVDTSGTFTLQELCATHVIKQCSHLSLHETYVLLYNCPIYILDLLLDQFTEGYYWYQAILCIKRQLRLRERLPVYRT